MTEKAARNVGASSHDALGAIGLAALGARTVSINGAAGQELDPSLSTKVSFSRDGVAHTILGSVRAAAADAAARSL